MAMIIKMEELANNGVLAGSIRGKEIFASCISITSSEPTEPIALFLDFSGVEVATASFLRESVIALKTYKRAVGSKQYPVLANVNLSIEDEFVVLTDARNDAIIACDLNDENRVSRVRMIGELDPKQAMTFELVKNLNGADASSLMEQFGKEEKTTSTTAWNNRLASLVQRGLLLEFTKGRAKFYRPIIVEAS